MKQIQEIKQFTFTIKMYGKNSWIYIEIKNIGYFIFGLWNSRNWKLKKNEKHNIMKKMEKIIMWYFKNKTNLSSFDFSWVVQI